MNGTTADPSVRTIRAESSNMVNMIGPSHHFFRTRMKTQSSRKMLMLEPPARAINSLLSVRAAGELNVAAYRDIQVAEQTIGEAVDPAVNEKLPAPPPSIANYRGITHVSNLIQHVELAQAIYTCTPIIDPREIDAVILPDILDDVGARIDRSTRKLRTVDGRGDAPSQGFRKPFLQLGLASSR